MKEAKASQSRVSRDDTSRIRPARPVLQVKRTTTLDRCFGDRRETRSIVPPEP
jgi:hypothetical protein